MLDVEIVDGVLQIFNRIILGFGFADIEPNTDSDSY